MLVRVHASSVNPVDWYGVTGPLLRTNRGRAAPAQGHGRAAPTSPGRSKRSARTSTRFRPGDEVFGSRAAAWAEYASPAPEQLAPKPANLTFEEAAAVPIAALTALQALRDKGRGPARAEGPDQRRVRRCRHLRGPDRQGVRRRGDRRLQHGQCRAGAIARRRPRRRLHAGGLHAAAASGYDLILDIAGSRSFLGLQAGADSRGDRRPRSEDG